MIVGSLTSVASSRSDRPHLGFLMWDVNLAIALSIDNIYITEGLAYKSGG